MPQEVTCKMWVSVIFWDHFFAFMDMLLLWLNWLWVFVDVPCRWWFCVRCTAARGSVSGSRSDPVCTIVSHSVPSDAECTGETTWFYCLKIYLELISLVSFYKLSICHITLEQVVNPPPSFKALDSDSDDSQDSSDSGATAHKTREILARRPSYR